MCFFRSLYADAAGNQFHNLKLLFFFDKKTAYSKKEQTSLKDILTLCGGKVSVACILSTTQTFWHVTKITPLHHHHQVLTCPHPVRTLENIEKVSLVLVKLPPDQLALIWNTCKPVSSLYSLLRPQTLGIHVTRFWHKLVPKKYSGPKSQK